MYQYNYPNIVISPVDISNKEEAVNHYVRQMLVRTSTMFDYDGLPSTIEKRDLERLVQCLGSCAIIHEDGNLWAVGGSKGGKPNVYYRPTKYIVANPALNLSKEYTIGEDCVMFRNDSYSYGLLPMFNRYATMIAENDITIRIADINARLINLITAPDRRTKDAGEELLKQIERGKMGICLDNTFLDGLKTLPYSSTGSTNNITQLLELHQYLKGAWMNEIGLSENFNLKREALNSNECGLGDDARMPLIDDMLNAREICVNNVNEMFGTNISVKLSSAWEINKAKEEMEVDIAEDNTTPNDEQEEG